MGRVNTPVVTLTQRQELEEGLRQDSSHCFRMRCQSILLKSEDRTSKEEASQIIGLCAVSIDNWVKRYSEEGIAGLQTKSGRGRKPLISPTEYRAAILSAIKSNRQRMRTMGSRERKEIV